MKHFISRRNFLKAAGVTAAASAMAAAVPQASAGWLTGKDAAVTILYTNDVHTYIDNKSPKLTYAAIAALKQGYVDEGKPVLLVDAGDHIQGTAYGSMDDGATIIGHAGQPRVRLRHGPRQGRPQGSGLPLCLL